MVVAEILITGHRGITLVLATRVVLAAHMFPLALFIVPEPREGTGTSWAFVLNTVHQLRNHQKTAWLGAGVAEAVVAGDILSLV